MAHSDEHMLAFAARMSEQPGQEKTAASHSILGLYEMLNQRYGADWYDWEPETLWQTLRKDLSKESIDDWMRNAVGALQVLAKTDLAFEQWHVFEKVVHALNFNHVDFETVQPHELQDIAAAVKVMRKIRPKSEFDDEVCAYVAACAKQAGVVYLPGELFPSGADRILNAKLGNDGHLAERVEMAWKLGDKAPGGGDEALKTQLARLREIKEHAAHA